jgi:hypothetical protein
MQSEGSVAEDAIWRQRQFENGDNRNSHVQLPRGEDDSHEKLQEILQVVNEVKGALTAIPYMQKSISHIKKTVAKVLSYSKS